MIYKIENRHIYRTDGVVKYLVGSVEKTETERINDTTVVDITYQFDLEQGQYVEQSRTEREELLQVPEPTPEEIQAQTLLNTEFLVVMAELSNM